MQKLHSATLGTAEQQISNDVFGLHARAGKGRMESSKTLLVDGHEFKVQINQDKQRRRAVQRGVVSYHHAARRLVCDAMGAADKDLLSLSVIDDTNVWVRFESVAEMPALIKQRLEQWRPELVKQLKFDREGRNVCCPALSHVQSVFYRRRRVDANESQQLRKVTIESPVVVLPATNWSTIYDRFKRWALIANETPGKFLEANAAEGSSIRDAMSNVAARVHVLLKDGLICNHNIACAEERAMASLRASLTAAGKECFCTVLPLECASHAVCLSAKPCAESFKGLPRFLTQLGHLLEQGRNISRLHDAIDSYIDRFFRYTPALREPGETAAHKLHAGNVLKASRVAMDIPEDVADTALDFFNDDWKEVDVVRHICIRGRCRVCAGDEDTSKTFAKTLLKKCWGKGAV